MNDFLTKAQKVFPVNILLVDDDPHVLRSLDLTFASPLFRKSAVATYRNAHAQINRPDPWHCWVLDMDLGEGTTGVDLMKLRPNFPFVMILSGLGSMNLASQATRLGALGVFDKGPGTMESLYDEVCKTAALGYLLGGKTSQYLASYKLLTSNLFATAQEWADCCCITLRQLQRICEMHPSGGVLKSIHLYYALYAMLWKGPQPWDDSLPPMLMGKDGFIEECIDKSGIRNQESGIGN